MMEHEATHAEKLAAYRAYLASDKAHREARARVAFLDVSNQWRCGDPFVVYGEKLAALHAKTEAAAQLFFPMLAGMTGAEIEALCSAA